MPWAITEGPASDLWGLGASLYTAVEGRPPFERDSPLASLTAVVADEAEPAVNAGALLPVITGLLAKDPGRRLGPAEAERMLRHVALGGAPRSRWFGSRPRLEEPAPDPAPPPGPEAPQPPDGPAPQEPESPPRPAPERRARPRWRLGVLAIAAAGIAAAGIAAALALSGSPAPRAASHPASPRSTPPSSRGASPSPDAPDSTSAGSVSGSPSASPGPAGSSPAAGYGTLPAGYHRFTNSTGFSIGVPPGWTISHAGHYVYVSDPANASIYLLIDQSDDPKPNPLADWEQQQANRAGSYPDYHLIRLATVSYPQAEKAADWEFTYKRDGVLVHVLNRNVLANARHAYALYWSTPESEWSADYRYFQAFAATFRPAPA